MRDKIDTRMLFENLQRFQDSLQEQEFGNDEESKDKPSDNFDMNKTDGEYVVSFGGTSTKPISLEDALDFVKKTKENGQTGEITINEAN